MPYVASVKSEIILCNNLDLLIYLRDSFEIVSRDVPVNRLANSSITSISGGVFLYYKNDSSIDSM